MSTSIAASAAPKPVGAYPHARRCGPWLLLSGIGARDPASNAIPGNVHDADGRLIGHDIRAQTHQVMANVRAVLEASGARWEQLVDVTVYLTDMAGDFGGYNAVWAEYFPDPASAPCRTTLGITALPTPIAIELQCTAHLGDGDHLEKSRLTSGEDAEPEETSETQAGLHRGFTSNPGAMLPLPLNFQRWIDEHRHLLKPPVGNKVIWQDGEFICMVVGGPNSRTDFHIEDGAEFFYQLEGRMTLRVAEEADGRTVIRDIPIQAGEIFLLPPRVPHSPQREAGSVGLVIERQRRPGEQDALCWYCPNCQHRIYEERFELADIETQFPAVFDRFDADEAHRTCARCGTVHPKRRG